MSFEEQMKRKVDTKDDVDDRINISILKYLWQASPLSVGRGKAIPKFLRGIRALKNFSDNELRILSNYLHYRRFSLQEVIFKEGDSGFGFYFHFFGAGRCFGKESIPREHKGVVRQIGKYEFKRR